MQLLAEAVDGYGLVGGKRRTANSANITTTETIVVDTASLTLVASSAFVVRFYCRFDPSVAATDVVARIRDTNTSGTERAAVNGLGVYTTRNYVVAEFVYKTTTAESKVWVGTLVRLAGTGNIQAAVPTHLAVYRVIPSASFGDF
jgi:hypothetical protein